MLAMPAFTTAQHIVPTFEDAPELDVLIIPGGMGCFDPGQPGRLNPTIVDLIVKFIQQRYPKLQYLTTVCTGAGIAARDDIQRRIFRDKAVAARGPVGAFGPVGRGGEYLDELGRVCGARI
jgi:putative intracellular protease/amidase